MVLAWSKQAVWAGFLWVVWNSTALALSCLPFGITDSYLNAAQSDAEYNVLKGHLTFSQTELDSQLERARHKNGGTPVSINARLRGFALGAQGFDIAATVDVTLKLNCLGPWCPHATSGRDVIVFAKKSGNTLSVTMDACSGDLYALTPEEEHEVLQCHTGGACLPREALWNREQAN